MPTRRAKGFNDDNYKPRGSAPQDQGQVEKPVVKQQPHHSGIYVAFEQFWDEVPARRRCAKAEARHQYSLAVSTLWDRESDAFVFLQARMKAYAESHVGQSKYAKTPAKWLEGEHYDDSPEAWEADKDEKQSQPREVNHAAIEEGMRKRQQSLLIYDEDGNVVPIPSRDELIKKWGITLQQFRKWKKHDAWQDRHDAYRSHLREIESANKKTLGATTPGPESRKDSN